MSRAWKCNGPTHNKELTIIQCIPYISLRQPVNYLRFYYNLITFLGDRPCWKARPQQVIRLGAVRAPLVDSGAVSTSWKLSIHKIWRYGESCVNRQSVLRTNRDLHNFRHTAQHRRATAASGVAPSTVWRKYQAHNGLCGSALGNRPK